jgi:hypothetical protein
MRNLKYIFFLTVFVLIGHYSYSQTTESVSQNNPTNFFQNFDFSSGKWELFGIANWEHTPLKKEQFLIHEKLGNFYSNDLTMLQQIKNDLTPQNKQVRGYASNYELELYKNDTLQTTIYINMDDDFVVCNGKRYVCQPNLIKNLAGKVKEIPRTEFIFPTLEDARIGFQTLSKIDSILLKPLEPDMIEWDWIVFNGYSKVLYVDSIKTFKSGESIIKQNIKKDSPTEKFILISSTSHNGVGTANGLPEQTFLVISNEKLGRALKTPKVIATWTKFKDIKIVVYGLTKEQIQKLLRQ